MVILLATSVMCSLFLFPRPLHADGARLFVTRYGHWSASADRDGGVGGSPRRLSDRIGPGRLVPIGMGLLAVALLVLSRVGLNSGVLRIAPALALAGVGIGLTTAPTTAAGLQAGAAAASGVASGVLNTFRATGLSFGIALMGAISASFGSAALGRPQAFVDGLSTALKVNAGIAVLAAIVAAGTVRSLQRPDSEAGADQARANRPNRIIPDAG